MRDVLPRLLPLLLLVAACGSDASGPGGPGAPDAAATTPAGANPIAVGAPYDAEDPALVAAASAAESSGDTDTAELYRRLDDVATGVWLTPEALPGPTDVGARVTTLVTDATGRDQVVVLVVYAVPDRDCSGGYSSGGLTEATYEPWVDAVAAAVAAVPGGTGHTAVVLEPDALASAVDCELVDDRTALLSRAVGSLHESGISTYVDAGHSDWVPPARMAELLRAVGVERVRGFATNVSNYQPTDAEAAYAEEISADLGETHYVIDTGRNGAATAAVADWCNPPGQALGQPPTALTDGGALDGYLWVKPPVESDGTCHGGPAAGQPWLARATELARAAGW